MASRGSGLGSSWTRRLTCGRMCRRLRLLAAAGLCAVAPFAMAFFPTGQCRWCRICLRWRRSRLIRTPESICRSATGRMLARSRTGIRIVTLPARSRHIDQLRGGRMPQRISRQKRRLRRISRGLWRCGRRAMPWSVMNGFWRRSSLRRPGTVLRAGLAMSPISSM